jgi:hypothetical protein
MDKPIIRYAKIASAAWNNLTNDKKTVLMHCFHLRPTNNGITIVSTLPYAPMRGITGIKETKDLEMRLQILYKDLGILSQDDEDAAEEKLSSLGFKLRQRRYPEPESGIELEDDFQAAMIRYMLRSNLSDMLGDSVRFVASELIFEQGHNRVDIVGYSDTTNSLYFFELKKARTTKAHQVANDVQYYSSEENAVTLKSLLANYPINPINSYKGIKGVIVMRYAANSNKKWQKLASDNKIGILFFEQYINFHKP